MTRRAALLGVLLVPLGCRSPAVRPLVNATGAERARVVFLVRHGEKRTDHLTDPALSTAGQARAQALADLLVRTRVTHLFTSELERTRATLRPLAARLGIEPVIVPAAEVAEQVRQLRELPPGSVAVLAGHSNTIPALARGLGVELENLAPHEGGDWLRDDQYDRLFVVILPPPGGGPVESVELRYGED